jgi:hypothetical protein
MPVNTDCIAVQNNTTRLVSTRLDRGVSDPPIPPGS